MEGGKGGFSQFRIRQTGKNSSGYDQFDQLACAGIELYGVLHPGRMAEELLHMQEKAWKGGEALADAQAQRKPITLTHRSDFDTNGALYCIGTQGGTCEYQNPQTTGAGTVTASSEGGCRPYAHHRFVQHQPDGDGNSTDAEPDSSITVALGLGAELEVTSYCLRHGDMNDDAGILRHWNLQASQDGQTWTTLRSHCNDQSLSIRAYPTAGWAVEGGKGAFSRFRIRQTDKNSDGYDYLFCAGIELYGVLHPPKTAD